MIPAYSSLTVGYQPTVIDYKALVKKIKELEAEIFTRKRLSKDRRLKIPVCYEAPYALDFEELSEKTGLSKTEIIQLHTATTFKVYMLGFLPGFVFMGKLPEALQCARKTSPRLNVPAGSVGLAGFQTGIYPSETPGGWQIIGCTPLKLFDPAATHPFLFQAGDFVNFHAISKVDFLKIREEVMAGGFKIESIYG